ncbi:MAG: hypothetical protein EYC69_08505 [Bacteroidetes bacterium]|nr:MAG: hypothetical protein EYC69_08505 [Bacteroidota bacterium]
MKLSTASFSCISLLLCFFIFPSIISGQTVKWSKPVSDNSKLPYMKIMGASATGIFVLRSNITFDNTKARSGFKTRKYLLQKFSMEMQLLSEYDLKAPVENARLADLQMVNGKVLLIFYSTDKGEHSYKFYAQYLTDAGDLEGQAVLMVEFAADNIDEDNLPGIVSSKDESKIAFTYRQLSKDKSGQYYHTVVMDSALNLIYTKDFDVVLPVKMYVPLTFLLTDEGNFFVLGMKFTTEKKVKSPGESFYLISGYNRSLNQFLNREVKVEDKFLTDVSITADSYNRKIVVIGFYSDRTTYSTAGAFYYSMNEDSLTESRVYTSAFPQEFMVKFMGERREGKSKELVNYSIDRLMLRKDGGAALVAESFYQTSRTYWDYYTQSTLSHYYYHFGSIMIVSINPDGKILWGNVVSKDQNSIDDAGYFSSYCSVVSGGKLYFIFNKYVNETSSVLIADVDGQGNQNTNVLFNETERVSILPHSGKQLDEDLFILPAYKENKFHFVQISFD